MWQYEVKAMEAEGTQVKGYEARVCLAGLQSHREAGVAEVKLTKFAFKNKMLIFCVGLTQKIYHPLYFIVKHLFVTHILYEINP